MRRFRRRHRRATAAALLPLALLATAISISAAAQGQSARVKLSTSQKTVTVGERFGLGGGVPGKRGMHLRIQFRANGSKGWTLVKRVHTDRKGHYGLRTHAVASGAYRAVPKSGRPSEAAEVRVRSHPTFHVGAHHLILGRGIKLNGLVKPGGRRAVKVLVRGQDRSVIKDATGKGGAFGARFKPTQPGIYRLQAVSGANERGTGGRGPVREVTAYRYAGASWYGPGLYGNGVACGGTLLPSTMGVANKTLPCGTKVRIRYHGRTVTVPVIDRGPYVAGRDYDLTEATKNALGYEGVDTILASR